jgi:hypothetical protein
MIRYNMVFNLIISNVNLCRMVECFLAHYTCEVWLSQCLDLCLGHLIERLIESNACLAFVSRRSLTRVDCLDRQTV